jgi:hypothetical protein
LGCNGHKLTRRTAAAAGEDPEPKGQKNASIHWQPLNGEITNAKEVLALAFLVCYAAPKKDMLKKWSSDVCRLQAATGGKLPAGSEWTMNRNVPGAMIGPVHDTLSRVWTNDELAHIAKTMWSWRGPGRTSGLKASHLEALVRKPRNDPKPPGSKKKDGPPRWRSSALLGVAELIKTKYSELRKTLKLDDMEELMTLEEELEAKTARVEKLERKLPQLVIERDTARASNRQAVARAKKQKLTATAARKDERGKVRTAERERYEREVRAQQEKEEERVDAAMKERRDECEAKEKYARTQVNTAFARARTAEKGKKAADERARRAQKKLNDAMDSGSDPDSEMACTESSESSESESKSPKPQLPFELLPRRDASGRYQAESWQMRALKWAQLGRGVAKSKVCHNIQDVVSLLCPGVEIPMMLESTCSMLRAEVTLSGEAMAAWKFAACKRVISFGWDESTKFGDAVFAINMQIQHWDGTVEDICLRGLTILSTGGTSAALLDHIEKEIFAHSRRVLSEWMETYEKANGAGSWAAAGGPDTENIGLHRLCEDTVLMTDTCNGARCTKRMLASAIMRTIEEKVGKEKWEAMSTEERNQKYKVFRGDCWQHLRNIMIDAMAAKGDELLKLKLQDDLAEFSAAERIEPDGGSVIRSSFKQFHKGGEYCKGRGRESEAWRKSNKKDALYLPFERAVGNRQDLKFDGCVPLFWNRLICIEFLYGYINCPKSENRLDKSLYTILRSNEFVGLLRANTLWKFLFSEPFRWLSGKSSSLKVS